MKPVSITIEIKPPEWARWITVDKSGQIWSFSDKPQCAVLGWYLNTVQIQRKCEVSNWKRCIAKVESHQAGEQPRSVGELNEHNLTPLTVERYEEAI